jgi:hypothetical protein
MQTITLLLIATSLGLVLGLFGASVLAVYGRARSGSAQHRSAGEGAASRTADDTSPPERQRWQREQQERSQ